jgi:Sperm-tail PG-rich repeat
MVGVVEQRPWTPTKRRGPIGAEHASPGPAVVQLPHLIGTKLSESKRQAAPAYSFGQRHRGKAETLGPGPAFYNIYGLSVKGKDQPPASSLQSRPKDSKIIETPAPGEYNVEKSGRVVVTSAPKYTFGIKKYDGKPSQTPGK